MPIGTFDKKEFEAQETPAFLKDLKWWGGIRFYREDFINFEAKQ